MQSDDETINVTMRPASTGRSFVILSTYEERQEALRHTEIMEDEVNHRSSRIFPLDRRGKMEKSMNSMSNDVNGPNSHIPPPPPQFANSPPKGNSVTTTNHTSISKPPSSPVPDYDNVQLRSIPPALPKSTPPSAAYDAGYANSNIVINSRDSFSGSAPANNNNNNNNNNNRRTNRVGSVTIGEYDPQRKEPGKFDFIAPGQKQQHANNRNNPNDTRNAEDLHSELQNTLTRSKLKKSNGPTEHQSNCPIVQNVYENYERSNVENITRKLQGSSLASQSSKQADAAGPMLRSNSNSNGSNGTGILKNGNRNSGGNYTKNSEKSITFGN